MNESTDDQEVGLLEEDQPQPPKIEINALNFSERVKEPRRSGSFNMDLVNKHERQRIEDKYLAHIKVTKCDQFRTLLVEETPDIIRVNQITGLYLIIEGILAFYLALCIVFEDNTRYTPTDPAFKVKVFFFVCLVPFLGLRVIAMICCKSPKFVLV